MPSEAAGASHFGEIVETAGKALDGFGVAVIVIGIIVATLAYLRRRSQERSAYRVYRQQVGRAILLGLEILVAADIIRTVAISPSFTSVGVLAIIVAIRTFLSFTLELELSGRWPWQKHEDAADRA